MSISSRFAGVTNIQYEICSCSPKACLSNLFVAGRREYGTANADVLCD